MGPAIRGGCLGYHRPSPTPLGRIEEEEEHSVESLAYLFAKCCATTRDVDGGEDDLLLQRDSPYDEVDGLKSKVQRYPPPPKTRAAVVTPPSSDGSSESESSEESIDFSAEFASAVKQAEAKKKNTKGNRRDKDATKFSAPIEASDEIKVLTAKKVGPSAKVGLIFTRSKTSSHGTIISKVLPDSIFADIKDGTTLEGTTVLAVNEVQVQNPRQAAEMAYRAKKEVRLTVQRGGGKRKTAQQQALEVAMLRQEQRLLKEKLAKAKHAVANGDDPAIEEYDSADDEDAKNDAGGAKHRKISPGNDDGCSVANSTADWSQADVVATAFPKKKIEQAKNDVKQQPWQANFPAPVLDNQSNTARIGKSGVGSAQPVFVRRAEQSAKVSKMASIRRTFGLKKHDAEEQDTDKPTDKAAEAATTVASAKDIMNDLENGNKEEEGALAKDEPNKDKETEDESKEEAGDKNVINELVYTRQGAGEEAHTQPVAIEQEPPTLALATERSTSYIIESIVSNLSYGYDESVCKSTDELVPMEKVEENKELECKKEASEGNQEEKGEDCAAANNGADDEEGDTEDGPIDAVQAAPTKKKGLFKRAFGMKSKPTETAEGQVNEKSKEADASQEEQDALEGKALLLGQPAKAKKPKKKSFMKRAFGKSKRSSKTDVEEESASDASLVSYQDFTRGIDLNVTITGDVEVHTPSKRRLLDCSLSPIKPLDVARTGSNATVSVTTTDESASLPTIDHGASTPPSRSSGMGQMLPPTPTTPTKIGESWDVSLLFGLSSPPSPSESIVGSTPVGVTGEADRSPSDDSFESRRSSGVDESMTFECTLQDESAVNICVDAEGQLEPWGPPPVNRKLDFEANDVGDLLPFQSRAVDVITVYREEEDNSGCARSPTMEDKIRFGRAKKQALTIAKEGSRLKNLFGKKNLSHEKSNDANNDTLATVDLTGEASMLF